MGHRAFERRTTPPGTPRGALAPLVFALMAFLTAAACDDGATPGDGPVVVSDLFDRRYCEVLLLTFEDPQVQAQVWNSLGLGECPEEDWRALDAKAVAEEQGVDMVFLNGPRHFLMDSVTNRAPSEHAPRTFGAVPMRLAATLDVPMSAMLARRPYTERTVLRDNAWTFAAGRTVHELRSPEGARYTMQSYARITDPELSLSDLHEVGDRLAPPQGWTYEVRTLDADLVVDAQGAAVVIQDDLDNTYQRSDG